MTTYTFKKTDDGTLVHIREKRGYLGKPVRAYLDIYNDQNSTPEEKEQARQDMASVGLEPYVPPAPPEPTEEELAQRAREQFKMERQQIVDAIKVTTAAGNTFDGDETSQGRMARAIIGLQASGVPTIIWVLADNTVIDATAAELTEAMILAGQAQAAVWVQPS